MNAIIGVLDAHTAMSSEALASEAVRNGLKDVLLNHAGLYESLREASQPAR
jgi:type I restriction enzyme, R subunit